MKTVITIAAYNEEKIIESVLEQIPPEYDVVVVDDGSTDSTRDICRKHGVTVVKHVINLGQGAAVTGLLGLYSTALTREAVWESFKKRHVYATSGPKIILNVRVADAPMGSTITWAASKGPIPIAVRAVGCDIISGIDIIRNGQTAFINKKAGIFRTFLVRDPCPQPGTYWYYVRVLQKDGNMAWSSPVWVTVE